jgi:acyl dehydratase
VAEIHLEYQNELTDRMIEEGRSFEGMPLRVEQYNYEASLDSIRHYAWGIGDMNPLWYDETYAASTAHGTVMAPPTFLYSVFDGAIGLGFVGIQPIYAGTRWKFYERLRRGDLLAPMATMGSLTVTGGRHSSRFVIQDVNTEYRRKSDGTLIAEAVGRTFRVPRSQASGGLSYEPRDQHVYTTNDLERIRRHAISEPVRGATPRYLEDVTVGEELPTVVKGPVDQITMTAYYAGCHGSPGYKGCEIAWHYRTWAREDPDRLPNNYDTTYFSEIVLPSLGHQNAAIAREIGMPGAYNNGPQKCAWMANAVTNWMGDDGFLSELEIQLRRPDIFGDTVWCGGTVTSINVDATVSVDLDAVNQLGERTAEGSAVIRLPRRRELDEVRK